MLNGSAACAGAGEAQARQAEGADAQPPCGTQEIPPVDAAVAPQSEGRPFAVGHSFPHLCALRISRIVLCSPNASTLRIRTQRCDEHERRKFADVEILVRSARARRPIFACCGRCSIVTPTQHPTRCSRVSPTAPNGPIARRRRSRVAQRSDSPHSASRRATRSCRGCPTDRMRFASGSASTISARSMCRSISPIAAACWRMSWRIPMRG